MFEIFAGLIGIGFGVYSIYEARLETYPESSRNWFFRKAGFSPELDRFFSWIVGIGFVAVGVLFLILGIANLGKGQ